MAASVRIGRSTLFFFCFFFVAKSLSSGVQRLKLIHTLYSEESPLYDSKQTSWERVRSLISLDESRQRHHFANLQQQQSAETPIQSGAPLGLGQYLVPVSIGTPPQTLLLIADTGSDLVWLQCSDSSSCSGGKHACSETGFRTQKSSTLSPIPCSAPQCQLVPAPRRHPCRADPPACAYAYRYADGSSSSGFLARDVAAIAHNASITFGCGLRSSGSSFAGAGGVLALGQGQLSFAQQAGSLFAHTFSYCLRDLFAPPGGTASFLLLGKPGEAKSMAMLAYTPLITNPLAPTFYYVSLAAIRVGNRQLPIPATEWAIDVLGNGGTVIDSGSTLAFLRLGAYLHLVSAFAAGVARRLPRVGGSADMFQGLELCYNLSSTSSSDESLSEVFPRVTLDFSAGLSLELPVKNYVVEVAAGVRCLAVRPTLSPFAFNVIGNLMQQGYHVEFDRANSRIGFARTECAS